MAFLSIGQCATLACLWEITAPKPGNVHRGADFEDLTFADLASSAVAIGPAMECAAETGLGPAVREAVLATRRLVDTNTNLGIVLLLAPLAAVPRAVPLHSGVERVLRSLTPDDARDVYEAIRTARPGGMGRVESMDVAGEAPPDLLAAMQAAADRDRVARQYVSGFEEVLRCVVPWLLESRAAGLTAVEAIIHTHVRLMAEHADSLIARKCGARIAAQSQARAAAVLDAGAAGEEPYLRALGDLDFWLRSDRHRRNPGTTADLVTAGLFAALREGQLSLVG